MTIPSPGRLLRIKDIIIIIMPISFNGGPGLLNYSGPDCDSVAVYVYIYV